ncbi:MAG: nitrilase-related carbon-nitrogen hydrolase [Candidatus Bathyarchaeia archaeon]|jgi:predicted amidohydrolase
MRVGFVQFDPKILEVEGNVDAALRLIGGKRADLIVLPELFNTGYNFRNQGEVASVAEPVPEGATTQALKEFSKRDGMMVVAGVAERKGRSLYNSAVVVKNGKYMGTYRKVHLFYNEKKFFKPGLEFKVFGKVGVMVCFDWYFPESARSLMLKGAEVIAHPSNLVLSNCPEAMKTRALENRVYAVTADRVGIERGLRYIGQSEIVNPRGLIIYRASATKEECVVRKIDLAMARNKTVTPRNNLLRDRMPQAYSR